MKVTIVSLTQSLVEGINTPEELIVHAARVSNPSNQHNSLTAHKLIYFLIRQRHWSPFEQASMGVRVETSRAVGAQILRHWTLSVQEFSQRYAEAVDMEPIELRKSGAKNRQSSTEVFDPEIEFHSGEKMKASTAINLSIKRAKGLYSHLLEAGVAKECARMVLPLTTRTTMYLTGDMRTWIHYLMQRTRPDAQLEHRLIAEEIRELFSMHFPNISKAVSQLIKQEAAFEEWLKIQPPENESRHE